VAPFYDKFDSYYEKLFYQHMREKYIRKITESNILEIGVGTGKNLAYYDISNKKITGIDLSKNMINQANHKLLNLSKSKIKKINLNVVNEKWHFPKESFDFLVATFVLCTNNNPIDLINQMYNVLKPEGKLLLFEWIPIKVGIYGFVLRLVNPLIKFFLGPSVYRKKSINFFKKTKWQLLNKEFFGPENAVFVLQKKI
jgi:demethylmenaquinone methyltransferase/2-methoxy-6-polyprenyl-1,4-benzoquinol methylase